jgi:hypothetical protein
MFVISARTITTCLILGVAVETVVCDPELELHEEATALLATTNTKPTQDNTPMSPGWSALSFALANARGNTD